MGQTENLTVAGVSLRPLMEALGTEPLIQQAMIAYQETLPKGQRMLGSLPLHLDIRMRSGRLGLEWMSVRPFQKWTGANGLEQSGRESR